MQCFSPDSPIRNLSIWGSIWPLQGYNTKNEAWRQLLHHTFFYKQFWEKATSAMCFNDQWSITFKEIMWSFLQIS